MHEGILKNGQAIRAGTVAMLHSEMQKRKEQLMKKVGKGQLFALFFNMFVLSAFTFGGGFTIVTLMKRKFVDELRWITEEEMLDMTALAQSSPGAIAVNAAILVGWKVGGALGMVTAVLATILPPMITLSIVFLFYHAFASKRYVALMLKGMQSGVAALILDAALSLKKSIHPTRRWLSWLVIIASFAATFVFEVNVIWIILCAMVMGIFSCWYDRKGKTP